LRREFAIAGAISELVSERDQNFLIQNIDGGFVLKTANATEDRGFLALQNAALKHITSVDPALSVRRIVDSLDGRDIDEWPNTAEVRLTRRAGVVLRREEPDTGA
jgi:Ser/Thr protein kinase RdoA (MazF antagonist)